MKPSRTSIYRPLPHKLFYHNKRVTRGILDSRTPPTTLDLDLTTSCNNLCANCTFPELREQPATVLPIDLAKNILKQAADFGIKAITYTGGGEPVLHKDLPELLQYSANLGLQSGLITNGRALTAEKAQRILPFLTWIRFSLDAGSPEVYRITHGLRTKQFHQVLQNIKATVETRGKSNIDTGIGISYLVFQDDPTDFQKAIEIANDLKVDFLQFKPMHRRDIKAVGGRTFTPKILDKARRTLEHMEFTNRVILSRFRGLSKRANKRCYGQQWTTAVGSDGKLYVCCEYKYNPRYLLGDLRESSLAKIWQSEHRRNLTDNLDVTSNCFLGCKLQPINNELHPIMLPAEKTGKKDDFIAKQIDHKHQLLLQASNGQIPADINFI